MKRFVTVDGNEAAAHVAYAFTGVSAIFPIALLTHGRAGGYLSAMAAGLLGCGRGGDTV